MTRLLVTPVEGVPEIRPGDDLARAILDTDVDVRDGDILVVAQKAVSKAEDRVVASGDRVDVALADAARVLRRRGDLVIAETRHGFVCANSGVDASNVEGDRVVRLPVDPDLSARRLRARIAQLRNVDVGVVVSDTFGRPWRDGQVNVAIGIAGFDPFLDYRGTSDTAGKQLRATNICVADEIASAAELVMGKTRRICAAIVRGAQVVRRDGSAAAIVRSPRDDLFR